MGIDLIHVPVPYTTWRREVTKHETVETMRTFIAFSTLSQTCLYVCTIYNMQITDLSIGQPSRPMQG